jgi:hypothetical protein
MVIVNVELAVALATESAAVMTTEKDPVTVGLPEITPAVEMLKPAGRDDPLAAVHDQVRLALDPEPPVAARSAGPYVELNKPAGSDVVVIVSAG